MKEPKSWMPSDIADAKYLGPIEFEGSGKCWHNFEVLMSADRKRLIFGGVVNVGFLESGYILREEGESDSELLQELLADLEVYYANGPGYVSRIVCNEQM